MKSIMIMDIKTLNDIIAERAVAFRCITDYKPVGGANDKIFPPTYEGGKYATEERINPETNETQNCVLVDSVQSQANRMEMALLQAHKEDKIKLPLLITRFDQPGIRKQFTVSSLEAPHRIADALIRDSLVDGKTIFRKSNKGSVLDSASNQNATGLFGLCPTALLFGIWDSSGPYGGLGVKFQRAIVSEIIGYDAVKGSKTHSRIDPAGIQISAGKIYERKKHDDENPTWTLDKEKSTGKMVGKEDGNEKGKPSQVLHGNIVPTIEEGGFTISKARQTTVISLPVLRRLHFPLNNGPDSNPKTNLAARSLLAALGIAAGTLLRADTDLRSRCQLFAQNRTTWEILDHPDEIPVKFEIDYNKSLKLLNDAISGAKDAGLPWEGEIHLTPSKELVELIKRSQELSTETPKE